MTIFDCIHAEGRPNILRVLRIWLDRSTATPMS